MPRAFNAKEEKQIRERLRTEGRKLFAAQGVLKTSIEQITKNVGISKGSFYKFYSSKEILFFELLETSQNIIRAPLFKIEQLPEEKTRAKFEFLLHQLFNNLCGDQLLQIMSSESEFMVISRKVPDEILSAHQKDDQAFLDNMTKVWNTKLDPPSRDRVAAQLTVLVMLSFNQSFLGERLLPFAVEGAIANLADCFF